MVSHKQKLCFFVPGTNSKKWIYALALESAWHDTKMASVVMEYGQITTVSRSDIKNAAPRMKKSIKSWEMSPYLEGFKPSIEKRLLEHWENFFAKTQEEQARIFADSSAAFTDGRAHPRPKRIEADASATTKNVPKPKKGKSKWRLNTQVATNKPVLPGGVASVVSGDSLVPEMWVAGLLTRFDGDSVPSLFYIVKTPSRWPALSRISNSARHIVFYVDMSILIYCGYLILQQEA
jgi:hypothetical protein